MITHSPETSRLVLLLSRKMQGQVWAFVVFFLFEYHLNILIICCVFIYFLLVLPLETQGMDSLPLKSQAQGVSS